MKFAANTFMFWNTVTDESVSLFSTLREMGFDGIEISLENASDINSRWVLEALRENELKCADICGQFGPNRDLRGNAAAQENCLQYIRQCVDMCVALEAGLVVGPLYSSVGRAEYISRVDRASQWRRVVKNLRIACSYADERGIDLAIEPLNRYETDFVNKCSDAVRLLNDVGNRRLRILLDTFHMHIEEEDVWDAIMSAGSYLALIHASESHRGELGRGQVHWDRVAKGLKEVDYRGWMVVESIAVHVGMISRATTGLQNNNQDGLVLAKKGLSFLKKKIIT